MKLIFIFEAIDYNFMLYYRTEIPTISIFLLDVHWESTRTLLIKFTITIETGENK